MDLLVREIELEQHANGFNDDDDDDGSAWTPLKMACRHNHTECARLLLTRPECDVNKADSKGWSPLKTACCGNHVDCVRLLLSSRKCDIGLQHLLVSYEKGYLERSTESVSAILLGLEKHHLPLELKMCVFSFLDALSVREALQQQRVRGS